MVARAIAQNGGIFIPNIGRTLGMNHGQFTVNITIISAQDDGEDPFVNAAGILRGRTINPVEFEREMRDEKKHDFSSETFESVLKIIDNTVAPPLRGGNVR